MPTSPTATLQHHFETLTDPRDMALTDYPLEEIVRIAYGAPGWFHPPTEVITGSF